MTLNPIPKNRVLSVMPTYQCTAACTHCGTMSTPRVKTSLNHDLMMETIQEASDNGFGLVVFTGGEPTLVGDRLLAAIRFANRLGMLTRVVTNCHWASDETQSDSYISILRNHGLNEINFSTGDQHVRFVPLMNVLRATRSAVEHSFTPAVMVETVADRKVTKDAIESHPYFCETRKRFPGRPIKINESPWMPLKPERVTDYPDGMAIDRSNISSCSGCDSVLQTTTLQADGSFGACCGLGMRLIPELQIGRAGSTPLSAVVNVANEDLLKRWIRAEGPERILAWAAEHDPKISWEGMYAHRCQACLRLYKDPAVRKVIKDNYMEKVPDVLFSEWLLYDYEIDRKPEVSAGESNL